MSDKTVGGIDDSLCRTVVALEFEQTCIVVCLLESEDIVDICTTKTVYALSIVAYHAHHLTFLSDLIDNGLLGKVGVLILIHKYVFKSLGILTSDFLIVGKQEIDVHEQVVEIHCISLSAPVAVS